MDGRIGGLLLAVAIVAAIAVAWLASTIIICLIMYGLVKSKSPLVARPSESICLGYSILWGVIISAWFFVASMVISTFVVRSGMEILTPDLRNGLVIDALNFASEMSLAIYATSLFLRRGAGTFVMAIVHPATLVAIFTGVTFVYDLYREGVTSFAHINMAAILQWFWGDYVLLVLRLGLAILQDPAAALDTVTLFLRSLFAEAGGNMYRLTPVISFLLLLLSVVRLIEGMMGKKTTPRLKLVNGYDFKETRKSFLHIAKWGLGFLVAACMLPLAYLIRPIANDGFPLLLSQLMYLGGWIGIICLAFNAVVFTFLFFQFTSTFDENDWNRLAGSAKAVGQA